VARVSALLLLAAALLLGGCGGGSGGESGGGTAAVACDDAGFRAQDEELYATKTAAANALSGGGDAAALLLDLRRGHKVLADYLAAHPPCDDALQALADTEQRALASIDEAVTSLEQGDDAEADLRTALQELTSVQQSLLGGG
jgi:hypothetical protein